VLRTISALPKNEALAILARAGAPLRPTAPGEVIDLNPAAIETLVEAARKLRLTRSSIDAVADRRFEVLSDEDLNAILAVLTENMAELALRDVDQRAALARLKIRDPDGFKDHGSAFKPQSVFGNRFRSARLPLVMVAFAALGAAAVVQQSSLLRLNSIILQQDRNLKSLTAEKQTAVEQTLVLTGQIDDLRKRVEQLNSQIERTAPPPVVSRLSCSGIQFSFDRSGRLRWTFPALEEGKTIELIVTGKSRSGVTETLTIDATAKTGNSQEQKNDRATDFVSIASVSVAGQLCNFNESRQH
jgi:hypothetical protein